MEQWKACMSSQQEIIFSSLHDSNLNKPDGHFQGPAKFMEDGKPTVWIQIVIHL